jgi:hypothetical protein
MTRILKLQRLAVEAGNEIYGNSSGSSTSDCCNG